MIERFIYNPNPYDKSSILITFIKENKKISSINS